MAAVNLSEVSTDDLIDELRLRGQGQTEPAGAGRPVEVPTRQAAQELGVSLPTLRSWMKHGHIHIGIYDKKDGKKRADIHVYRHMLDAEKRRLTT